MGKLTTTSFPRRRKSIGLWAPACAGAACLFVLLLTVPAFAAPTPRTGAPVALSGPTVTAGDVFAGLEGLDAARYLAPAPAPGEALTLPASDLLRIAKALDLPWRPSTGSEQVILTTPATVIDTPAVEAVLIPALLAKGAPGDFALNYTSSAPPRLILPGGAPPPELVVTQLSYDPEKHWFEAHLRAGGATQRVEGSVEPVATVPVLGQAVQAGTLLGPVDLTTLRLPAKALQRDVFLDPTAIAGQTARRALQAGTPLRAGDIAPPRLVARGEAITIVLRDGAMELTAVGRALENGAKGDVVRVVNTASGRSLDARVIGDHQVSMEGL